MARVDVEALGVERPKGDPVPLELGPPLVGTWVHPVEVRIERRGIGGHRNESGVREVLRPVVGIVGLQEEGRFGSTFGQQPVAVPRGAVHWTDDPRAPVFPVPVQGVFQQLRAGVGVEGGVVTNQACRGRLALGVASPPEGTTGDQPARSVPKREMARRIGEPEALGVQGLHLAAPQ